MEPAHAGQDGLEIIRRGLCPTVGIREDYDDDDDSTFTFFLFKMFLNLLRGISWD